MKDCWGVLYCIRSARLHDLNMFAVHSPARWLSNLAQICGLRVGCGPLTSQHDKTLYKAAVSENQESISCLASIWGRVHLHTCQCANASCVTWWPTQNCFCSQFDHTDVVWSCCCSDTAAPCAFSLYILFGGHWHLRTALPIILLGGGIMMSVVVSDSEKQASALLTNHFISTPPVWAEISCLVWGVANPGFGLNKKCFWSNWVLQIFVTHGVFHSVALW